MKIVITGGTGFVGRHLINALVARAHEVTAFTRDPGRAPREIATTCRLIAWDYRREPPDQASLARADVVINLMGEPLGAHRWSKSQKQEILDSRVLGTRRLVEALNACRKKKLELFISASATGYYAKNLERGCVEEEPPAEDFLGTICRDWEHEAHGLTQTKRALIARMGVIWGEDGGMLKPLLKMLRYGLGGQLGSGKQWISWIHLTDAVAFFVRAIEDERYHGTLNLVSPEPIRHGEFVELVSTLFGKPQRFPLSSWQAKLLLGDMAVMALDGQKADAAKLKKLNFVYHFPGAKAALEDIVRSYRSGRLSSKT